jgi:YjbE family integral membrane protein
LSGDNAILIALACRNLPQKQRRIGIVLGAGGAIALRIAFTLAVARLLDVPYLTLGGGLFVIFLATKLPHEDTGEPSVEGKRTLLKAVASIIIADVLVSLDNALALAAAASGSARLIILGLLVSGPTIMLGAGVIAALMKRLPALVWIGAVILGWAGGQLIARDPVLRSLTQQAPTFELWAGGAAAAAVLLIGAMVRRLKPT